MQDALGSEESQREKTHGFEELKRTFCSLAGKYGRDLDKVIDLY